MSHYTKQSAHHLEMYNRAIDCDNEIAASHHMQEYLNYQELIKRVK